MYLGLVLCARRIVSISDLLRVPIRHCLQRIDEIDELKSTVHIFIVPTDVIDDVLVFELLGALMLGQKDSKIV